MISLSNTWHFFCTEITKGEMIRTGTETSGRFVLSLSALGCENSFKERAVHKSSDER